MSKTLTGNCSSCGCFSLVVLTGISYKFPAVQIQVLYNSTINGMIQNFCYCTVLNANILHLRFLCWCMDCNLLQTRAKQTLNHNFFMMPNPWFTYWRLCMNSASLIFKLGWCWHKVALVILPPGMFAFTKSWILGPTHILGRSQRHKLRFALISC